VPAGVSAPGPAASRSTTTMSAPDVGGSVTSVTSCPAAVSVSFTLDAKKRSGTTAAMRAI
jgi:hypothetical protein